MRKKGVRNDEYESNFWFSTTHSEFIAECAHCDAQIHTQKSNTNIRTARYTHTLATAQIFVYLQAMLLAFANYTWNFPRTISFHSL